MKKRLMTALLLLLPALAAPWLLAQDDQGEVAAEDTTVLEAPDTETDPADESATEDTVAAEGDDTAAPEPGDDDFVPTAQISEDLSVSFPVDI